MPLGIRSVGGLDGVAGLQHYVPSAVVETHRLVGGVEDGGAPMEPGRAEDKVNALKGQYSNYDIGFVLPVNLNCEGGAVGHRDRVPVG